MTEDPPSDPGPSAEDATAGLASSPPSDASNEPSVTGTVLNEIDRLRRSLWFAILAALVIVSSLVVVMSYWTDVFPDSWRKAIDFAGWRLTFLVLSSGFVVYAIARERILRRITKRYIDEALRAQRLAEADRIRNEVVATVTHQLKTPLTSILGYAMLLRKRAGSLTEQQRAEYVDVMEKQGLRVMQLIEELLQSSRLQSGETKLQRVPVDIAGIARTVAEEMGTARGREIEVVRPPVDLDVYGDPAAIEHVITNLVDNACKYSPEGSVVRITLDEHEGGAARMAITNAGPGIPPEELSHVFERFRQAPNARGHGSVGLGLHIVRELVRAHGGRVWAESANGRTTVNVVLPRRRARRDDTVEAVG